MAPLVDPGTDCEDELPIPAGPPTEVGHEMDSELEKVFIDVVSLSTMVTPVCDIDGAFRVPQAECPVIALPAMSAFVIQLSLATSPAGPKLLSPILSPPSPASVGVSSVPPDVSGSSRARGFHDVQCGGDESDSTGGKPVVYGRRGGWPVACYSPDPWPSDSVWSWSGVGRS